jgi:hypothetical protein
LQTFCTACCRFSVFHTLSIRLNHLPPVIPLSRVANIRSVHTAAWVHAHRAGTSLPCLAFGTPGRGICSCVSFTFPASCPPWLHGRCPFHSYYGNSDSYPAPLRTRTGILGSCSQASRHSISNHPMHPLWRQCFAIRPGLATDSLFQPSAILRTSCIPSSLVSCIRPYRVCVTRPIALLFYGLSVHFELLSTLPREDAVTFSYRRLAPPERDFHPPACAHSQAHQGRRAALSWTPQRGVPTTG